MKKSKRCSRIYRMKIWRNYTAARHDPVKVNAAYAGGNTAQGTTDSHSRTKRSRGFGLGTGAAEGRNVAHNHLDMTEAGIKNFP